MTELTPERIRDAAEVVSLLYGNTTIPATGNNLRAAADKLEHDQADKAKRENRIEQLTDEIITIFNARGKWPDIARVMLDRYPVLAEQPDCGHPGHGKDNHACAPFLDYRAMSDR